MSDDVSNILVTLYLSLDSLLAEGSDLLQGLRDTVPGEPGLDYPILSSPQSSSFSCSSRVEGGYYADVDQRCQVYHVCLQQTEVSFLCPNGTLFNQVILDAGWAEDDDCCLSRIVLSVTGGSTSTAGPLLNTSMLSRELSEEKII